MSWLRLVCVYLRHHFCMCFFLSQFCYETVSDSDFCLGLICLQDRASVRACGCGHTCLYTSVSLIMWLPCGMAWLLWMNVAVFSGSPEAQVSLSFPFSFALSLSLNTTSARGPQDHYPITQTPPEAGLNLLPHLPLSSSYSSIYRPLQEPVKRSSRKGRN